jgi:hypothetical protein
MSRKPSPKKPSPKTPSVNTKPILPENTKTVPDWVKIILVPAVVSAVVSSVIAILVVFITTWFSLTEPDLRLVNLPLEKPEAQVIRGPDGIDKLLFRIGTTFKNHGLKTGHIERVELAEEGLSLAPDKFEVRYLDKSGIGWMEQKRISCQFLATMNPRTIPDSGDTLKFRVTYIAQDGRELGTEVYEISRRTIKPTPKS